MYLHTLEVRGYILKQIFWDLEREKAATAEFKKGSHPDWALRLNLSKERTFQSGRKLGLPELNQAAKWK